MTVEGSSGFAEDLADKLGRRIGIDSATSCFDGQGFHRLDQSRLRDQGGSGVGPAIGSAITEAPGGNIHKESRTGQGAKFRVELPGALDHMNNKRARHLDPVVGRHSLTAPGPRPGAHVTVPWRRRMAHPRFAPMGPCPESIDMYFRSASESARSARASRSGSYRNHAGRHPQPRSANLRLRVGHGLPRQDIGGCGR